MLATSGAETGVVDDRNLATLYSKSHGIARYHWSKLKVVWWREGTKTV